MPWPEWIYKADQTLRGVGRDVASGVKGAVADAARKREAARAWDDVAICECRVCGVGKLRQRSARRFGGRLAGVATCARLAAWMIPLGAFPAAFLLTFGGLAGVLLAVVAVLVAVGFATPLLALAEWLRESRHFLRCDHCAAVVEADP